MKQITTNSKTFLTIAAFILATASTMPAMANNRSNKEKTETAVAVKYLGTVNDQPVLEIKFDNASGEAITVTLRDGDGLFLYAETFSGKQYAKKFLFDRVDLSEDNIRIELKLNNKNSREMQIFEISKTTELVDNVVINTIK